MSVTLVRAAPFLDLMNMAAQEDVPLAARKAGFTPQSIARAGGLNGRSWGLMISGDLAQQRDRIAGDLSQQRDRNGKTCIACMGLFPAMPREDGTPRFEAWFFARPEAARHMLAITRLAQLTAEAVSQDAPVELYARVADGFRPSERLAAAIGCRKQTVEGGFGVWIYETR